MGNDQLVRVGWDATTLMKIREETFIRAFGLDWHLNTSKAVDDCLITPLSRYVSIDFQAWDGFRWHAPKRKSDSEVYVFFQLPPPRDLLYHREARSIWIPMWDYVQRYPQDWWNTLPKRLRVIAFSEEVHQKAQIAGLTCLRLKYFKDPRQLTSVNWNSGRVLLYWNRIGLFTPRFMARLCQALDIDTLLIQQALDRGLSRRAELRLPRKLGKTEVEFLPRHVEAREDYFEIVSPANVYLAPRDCEGIGMAFLEAMSRGAAVLAYDAPTMNEYIQQGQDGYLFASRRKMLYPARLLHIVDRFGRSLLRRERLRLVTPVAEDQDWQTIASLDLQRIGSLAAARHRFGFLEWQSRIPEYVEFIVEW